MNISFCLTVVFSSLTSPLEGLGAPSAVQLAQHQDRIVSATKPKNFCWIFCATRRWDCSRWLPAPVDLGARHLADRATWGSRERRDILFPGTRTFSPQLTTSLISGETERGGSEMRCRLSGNGCWLHGLWWTLSWNLTTSFHSDW